mmetsp:Transcript_92677/g.181570  ORF Transcript_92677/g.181570 Transcript_92677/m.181570 type:complete len:310 (-) Transcript_92677:924-1853(-)
MLAEPHAVGVRDVAGAVDRTALLATAARQVGLGLGVGRGCGQESVTLSVDLIPQVVLDHDGPAPSNACLEAFLEGNIPDALQDEGVHYRLPREALHSPMHDPSAALLVARWPPRLRLSHERLRLLQNGIERIRRGRSTDSGLFLRTGSLDLRIGLLRFVLLLSLELDPLFEHLHDAFLRLAGLPMPKLSHEQLLGLTPDHRLQLVYQLFLRLRLAALPEFVFEFFLRVGRLPVEILQRILKVGFRRLLVLMVLNSIGELIPTLGLLQDQLLELHVIQWHAHDGTCVLGRPGLREVPLAAALARLLHVRG